MSKNIQLDSGEELKNDRLCEIFKCGPQGGMRRSHKTSTLVIVSNHVKSIYDDRWEGDTFYYTGMGTEGDQSLTFSQNRTLAESGTNGVEVHLFEVFREKIYTYIGRMALAAEPYEEIQPDVAGHDRKVWLFPLVLIDGHLVSIDSALLASLAEKKEKQARRLSYSEIERRAKASPKKSGSRKATINQYVRDTWVAEYAKRRASGICQLCQNPAPFKKADGSPYLETHHIDWLAEGGEDTIKNTVALCPNCHRKMHVLNLKKDKQVLLERNVSIELDDLGANIP